MDKQIKNIINEISEEEGLSKSKVEKYVRHFFDWQRQEFINLNYSRYDWRYFGKFEVIKSKYEKKINKTKLTKKENEDVKETKKTD